MTETAANEIGTKDDNGKDAHGKDSEIEVKNRAPVVPPMFKTSKKKQSVAVPKTKATEQAAAKTRSKRGRGRGGRGT